MATEAVVVVVAAGLTVFCVVAVPCRALGARGCEEACCFQHHVEDAVENNPTAVLQFLHGRWAPDKNGHPTPPDASQNTPHTRNPEGTRAKPGILSASSIPMHSCLLFWAGG